MAKRKEDGGIDTTWQDHDKIIKIISHSDKFHIKMKQEIKYNDLGDEIETVSYK